MSEELHVRDIRLQKLARMRELGHDPYQVERFASTGSPKSFLDNFEEGKEVSLAGRIVSYRNMGKAGFAHLSDGEEKIQFYCRKDELGPDLWEVYELLDIGDHVGVLGFLFVTKTGERSIHAKSLTPLSKALHTLPLGKEKDGERWYGLSDIETRYRHRHLDLLCNPEARKMLIDRMKITSAVRRFFDDQGFLEVETPLLQFEAGGAAATPFKTHYNAYDAEVKLRISLELYLKRLICGDLPKVYEIGRVFRNEGISNRHNPEFSLLEWYEAFVQLEDVMETVERLFRTVAQGVYGSPTVQIAVNDGMSSNEREAADSDGFLRLDFGKPWRRINLLEEIERLSGVPANALGCLDDAQKALGHKEIVNPINGKRIVADDERHLGGLIEKLLEVFVEPTLVQPTFVVGYPIETSPLAKKDPNNQKLTRRFEGYIRGREVCNAFSEINDPIDQRERFEHQVAEKSKGDAEAHPMDEEYIFALECGMPPTGGCGIGIDRLAMMLTGADAIREVILFPTMKPTDGD